MNKRLKAKAQPEKRLFISLITRDIPLIAAFLDLIDNAINAAVEPMSDNLGTAEDYVTLSADPTVGPDVDIHLKIDDKQIEIKDTASGISAAIAAEHVFKFGRADDESHEHDRLSVYGIGLKRAIFKLGNKIVIRSDHVDGGFDLKLDVSKWAKDTTQPWVFDITERLPVVNGQTGTKIIVTELYDDTVRRISDGIFLGQLREAISRTYPFYLAKFVNIFVNNTQIEGTSIDIGANHASETFSKNDVTCAITAGIGASQSGGFKSKSSGWFVFCNGRAVISADKGTLTGWGEGLGLPQFQPKHRPFLGTVFFVSKNAENLPWTTTKSGINEDSSVWQEAKRHMVNVGRQVISYLDSRYGDEGSDTTSKDLEDTAGPRISVISTAISDKKNFEPPKREQQPKTTRIQYDVNVSDLDKIKKHLHKPSMGGAQIGRHTFNYFLQNELGEE